MDAIFGLAQISAVAKMVWNAGKKHKVWAFHAPMGTGKTTFIHALAKELNVEDAVGSPTYALVNEYQSPVAGTILHMDWYRIKDEQEALDAGIEDHLHSGHYCWVEWPEKVPAILPEDTFHLHMEVLDEQTRRIFIEK
jgi:tRNA threonylcarbamoyladenosine biosynthesis protein TsaE